MALVLITSVTRQMNCQPQMNRDCRAVTFIVQRHQSESATKSEGEIMKQYFAILLAVVCVLGLGAGARAQDEDAVVVKVPYEFVAGRRVLPAGTYTVSRWDSSGSREKLVIRSYETKASVLVLPTYFAEGRSQDPHVDFETVGNKHFLSEIQTSDGIYIIAIPPSAIKLAQMEQHLSAPSGGN
jgi:hypothetical protein